LELPHTLFDILGENEDEIYGRLLLFFSSGTSNDGILKYINSVRARVLGSRKSGGFAITIRNSGLILLEASSSALYDFTSFLYTEQESHPFASLRVGCFCDDVNNLVTSAWSTQSIPAAGKEGSTQIDDVTRTVHDLYSNCISISKSSSTLDTVSTFPPSEVMNALSVSSGLMTIPAFYRTYCAPVEMSSLDQETWPLQDINSVIF